MLEQTAGVDLPSLSSVVPKAHAFVRTSRLTAAELIYSPSQIALACFSLADRSLVDTWLGVKEEKVEEVEKKRGGNKEEGGRLEREALVKVLEEIGEMIMEAQRNPVDKARVKDVDMRLKWARNPEKDPKSALCVFPSLAPPFLPQFPDGILRLLQVQEAESGGRSSEGSEGKGESGQASRQQRRERFRLNEPPPRFPMPLCIAPLFVPCCMDSFLFSQHSNETSCVL